MDSEYGNVMRVSVNVTSPKDYHFLPSEENPVTAQYARDMTLASGQSLYEVWDFWQHTILGYHVPVRILSEARSHRGGLQDWKLFAQERRDQHFQVRQLVLDIVPDIPVMSGKIVTERLIRHSYRGRISKKHVEDEVVKHARYCWTRYCVTLEERSILGIAGRWEEEAVEKMVRPRLRGILELWMGNERSAQFREDFLSRHRLGNDIDGAAVGSKGGVVIGGGLTWFGGAETVGNMRAGTSPREQRRERRFL